MTLDLATIGIAYDTSGLVKGTAALKENEQAANRTADASDRTGASAKRASDGFSSLGNVLRGLGLGLVLREFIQLSDQYTKFTSQLKLATQSTQEYAKANAEVQRIAKLTEGGLGTIGVLYARITSATRELGVSQSQVSKVTETVGLSLKVAGATAAESSSAMLQLSQAFGAGALRGEEFNAVNEAAPGLLRVLAESMGVTQGALKKLAEDGKLTTDVLLKAFTDERVLAGLREQGEQVRTISGAFQLLKDQLVLFVGQQNEATGAGAAFVNAIGLVANNLDLIAAAAAGFVTLKVAEAFTAIAVRATGAVTSLTAYIAAQQAQRAATLAAAQAEVVATQATTARLAATEAALVVARQESIAQLASANTTIAASSAQIAAAKSAGSLSFALATLRQGEIALTGAMAARSAATAELAILGQQQARLSAQIAAANTAHAASQAALTAATVGGGAAAGLATRALGFLGGPIGAITTLLGIGVTAWLSWGKSTETAVQQAEKSVLDNAADFRAELQAQIDLIERRNRAAAGGAPTQENKALENLGALEKEIARLKTEKTETYAQEQARIVQLQATLRAYGGVVADVSRKEAAANSERERLNGTAIQSVYKKYATDAEKLTAALDEARKAAGGIIPPDLEKRIRASFSKSAIKEFNKELSEQAKLLAELAGLSPDYLKDLSDLEAIRKKGKVTEAQYIALVEQLIAKQPSSVKLSKEQAEAFEQVADAMDAGNKIYREQVAELSKGVTNQRERIAALELEAEAVALAEAGNFSLARGIEIVTIARLDEKRAQSIDPAVIKIIEEEIAARQKLLTLIQGQEFRAANKEVADAAAKDWERFAADLERGLTDSLFRAFEAGRGFFSALWDGIRNLFKTTVLKAIIQPVVGGVTGALGLTSAANAATTSSGIGNLLNLGSNLSTAYSALTGSFINTIGSAATAAGNLFGSTAAAEFGLGIQGFQTFAALEGGVTGALGAGASTGSALSSAAAAGPYVLAAVAALNALGVFRSKKIVDGGIQGELGGQVNDFALQRKGGTLFSGPSYRVLDRGVSAQNDELQKAYSAIRDTVAGMAEQLGIGNDAIKAFTVQLGSDLIHPDTGGFGIKTQGLSQDEIVKKIEAALVSANEQLAAFALGTTQYTREGETAVQTLSRLNQSLTGVNGVFDNLGLSLIDIGLAGADTASKFVELFGGMEQFAAASNSYYQNFFSEAERTANTVQALTGEFAALGLELPTSREAFRALVEAQRELGDASLPTVARLLQLSETFAAVVPPTEQLTAAASDLASTVTEAVQSFQTALVSLGPNPFTPTVDGFQGLLAQMNADIAAANAQISGTVASTYQTALDSIQQRAATLQAQLEPGYAANIQNQLDQATYGRSIAEANLRYLQSVGDEVNAVFQQERIAAFTAEIARLTAAMQAGPEVQAFIDSQIALLNFQNGQRAADLIGGLNEAVADLGRTDAERRIAAIAKQYDDYIKQLTDLNQLTPANIAAVEAWRAAMLNAANTGADAAGTLTDATNQLAQAQDGVQSGLQSLFDYGQRITQQIDALRRQAAAELLQARGGVTGALDNLRTASENAAQNLADAQKAAADQMRDAMRSVADSVGAYLRELAGSSAGSSSIFQQRDFNGSQFQDLAARALAGDTTAGAQVTDAAKAYIDSLRETSTSTLDFAREELRIRAQLAQIQDLNTVATDGQTDAVTALQQAEADALKASQDYAKAVADAAAAGVTYTATVKTSTSDFNEALAAFIEAQKVAQAVQAELASADQTLVQQYAGLTAELQDFQARTGTLLDGFTGKVDTLGDLLNQYADAVAKLNAAQGAAAGGGGGGGGVAAPTQGGGVTGSILDQLRNDPAFRAESIRIAATSPNSTKGELVRALEAAGFTPEQIAVNVSNVLGESVSVSDINTIRGFANGGFYPGGMALVGERGPELINFANPGQVYTADQTRSLMGGDTSRMEAQMSRMTDEIISLRRELQDIKTNTGDTKTILRRVTQDGDAITTVAA